jgi:hypothetical protein
MMKESLSLYPQWAGGTTIKNFHVTLLQRNSLRGLGANLSAAGRLEPVAGRVDLPRARQSGLITRRRGGAIA